MSPKQVDVTSACKVQEAVDMDQDPSTLPHSAFEPNEPSRMATVDISKAPSWDGLDKPQTPSRDSTANLQSLSARHSAMARAASESTLCDDLRPAKSQKRADFSDFHFVTFFSLGREGDSGHRGFQLTSLDMSWARCLAKSHPGAKLAIMTDLDCQFDFDGFDMEVCRNPFDTSKLGRNSYANLYQFQGQVAYLRKLQQEGADVNVVFMDTDILVLKPLTPIFETGDWAFGCTISDSKAMPVNIGMQFVKAGRYTQAIAFLEEVLARYRIEPVREFCAGQIAIAETLGLYGSYDAQLGICMQANAHSGPGCAVREIGPNKHRVAFTACARYNYCNLEDSCCTDPHRWMRPLTTPSDFLEMDVRALHFVGWRKSGLMAVTNAFLAGELEEAFAEFVSNYSGFKGYGEGHSNQSRDEDALWVGTSHHSGHEHPHEEDAMVTDKHEAQEKAAAGVSGAVVEAVTSTALAAAMATATKAAAAAQALPQVLPTANVTTATASALPRTPVGPPPAA